MSLFRRVLYWLRFRRFEADLQDELQFHRDMTRERLVARGSSAADADRASRRALGNTVLAVEDARSVWVSRMADDLGRDARHAFRLIRRQPGFSALTIATLAIGIGAVTTVVSILQAEVWRPLPFPGAAELVTVAAATTDQPDTIGSLRATEYAAIRSQTRQLAGLAGFRWNETRVVTGELGAERVSVAPVSTSFFDVLRVTPALGRGFRPDEERPGAGETSNFKLRTSNFEPRNPGTAEPRNPVELRNSGTPEPRTGTPEPSSTERPARARLPSSCRRAPESATRWPVPASAP